MPQYIYYRKALYRLLLRMCASSSESACRSPYKMLHFGVEAPENKSLRWWVQTHGLSIFFFEKVGA